MARILRHRRPLPPILEVDVDRPAPQAAVVLLHGGPERGFGETRRWSLPYRLMLPFGREVRDRSQGRVAVIRLRHRHSGWNGGEESPLREARWAVDELERTAPGIKIGLLGHSLGGRTALRAAEHPAVTSIVALAPWVPPGEAVEQLRGREVLIVQGDRDRVCPPTDTRRYVADAEGAGIALDYQEIPGSGHLMLRHRDRWLGLAADHLARTLLDSDVPPEPGME